MAAYGDTTDDTLPPLAGAVNAEPSSSGRDLPANPSQCSVSRQRPTDRASELWNDFANAQTGTLGMAGLEDLLGALDINNALDNYKGAVQSVAGPNAMTLNKEQT